MDPLRANYTTMHSRLVMSPVFGKERIGKKFPGKGALDISDCRLNRPRENGIEISIGIFLQKRKEIQSEYILLTLVDKLNV